MINPEYRALDGQVRTAVGQLSRRLAEFGKLSLQETIEPKKVDAYIQKKVAQQEVIERLEEKVSTLKKARKATERHIDIDELPEEEKFKKLSTKSKCLIDSIKMIAYRAETSMANALKEKMSRPDDSRTLLQAIYQQEADLIPDEKSKTLTVRLHHMANHSSDRAIQMLCEELNATETIFPRTELRLVYELGTSQNP